MADTRFFQPIASMPQIDYGAAYENAKARKQAEDEYELNYLRQFKKMRGAFAPSVKPQVDAAFATVQELLDAGDTSIEGKKALEQAFSNYQDKGAAAMEFTNAITQNQAKLLSNGDKFTQLPQLMMAYQNLYENPLPDGDIEMAMQNMPKLSNYARYNIKVTTPQDFAMNILGNARTFDPRMTEYYDEKTGVIKPEKVAELVSMNLQNLPPDAYDAIIQGQRQGKVMNTIDDLVYIQSMAPEEKSQYIQNFSDQVLGILTNNMEQDRVSESEARAQSEADWLRRQRLSLAMRPPAAQTPSFNAYNTSTLTLTKPVRTRDGFFQNTSGENIKSTDINPPTGDINVSWYAPVSGTRPKFNKNGKQYTINSIYVDENGKQMVVASYEQRALIGRPGVSQSASVYPEETFEWNGTRTSPGVRDMLTSAADSETVKRINQTFNMYSGYSGNAGQGGGGGTSFQEWRQGQRGNSASSSPSSSPAPRSSSQQSTGYAGVDEAIKNYEAILNGTKVPGKPYTQELVQFFLDKGIERRNISEEALMTEWESLPGHVEFLKNNPGLASRGLGGLNQFSN